MPVLPRLFKRSAAIKTPPPRTTAIDEAGLLKSQPQYNQLDEVSIQAPAMIHPRTTQATATGSTASPLSDTLEFQTSYDDDIERDLAAPIHVGKAAFSRQTGIVRTVSITQTEGRLSQDDWAELLHPRVHRFGVPKISIYLRARSSIRLRTSLA
ncbi:MAG: hypothetical protein M1821_003354 [Bathelium mastoideum]|nr:MAG: hypothetical protein M1821_003354 [Bathelium mastoideum]